ncbi:MAG: AAA family ATPase [Deltaproteobacteria bacterium]|nr:AAA family ATPase [Deltaproteobacteria bacterium]
MYEDFFKLTEKPFNLTPDPEFLYLSVSHKEALDHLYYGLVRGEGFISIYGDVGVGKTTISRELLRRLNDDFVPSLVLNPFLTEKEFLRSVLDDFGLSTSRGTKMDLLDRFNGFLIEKATSGEKPVVIIDEAQNLSPILLEQIRIISNLEANNFKLVQIVLVGQKELRDKLSSKGLRQLNQRITVRYEIKPLGREDTGNYIFHRLAKAGSRGDVSFSTEAIGLIYGLSGGVPRLINVISDRAMLSAYVRSSKAIEKKDVNEGVQSLGESEGLLRRKRAPFGLIFGYQGILRSIL